MICSSNKTSCREVHKILLTTSCLIMPREHFDSNLEQRDASLDETDTLSGEKGQSLEALSSDASEDELKPSQQSPPDLDDKSTSGVDNSVIRTNTRENGAISLNPSAENSDNGDSQADHESLNNGYFPRSSITNRSHDEEEDPKYTTGSGRQNDGQASSASENVILVPEKAQIESALPFIKVALESLNKSKEAKRIPQLAHSLSYLLKVMDEGFSELPQASTIVDCLRLVCLQGSHVDMQIVALDCLEKLFTFSLLDQSYNHTPSSEDVASATGPPLLDQAVFVVCDTWYPETNDPKLTIQVIKALTAAITNDTRVIHGSTLLRAIRQLYSIFILARSSESQQMAQISLTQAVQAVFDRAKKLLQEKGNNAASHGSLTEPSFAASAAASSAKLPLTLEQMRSHGSRDSKDEAIDKFFETSDYTDFGAHDAFILFRTFCKLSEKTDVNLSDLKSQGMRSKLLSLHLLHMCMKTHISVFCSPILTVKIKGADIPFSEAIKPYLCSMLSSNAASISAPVYEICAEIFSLMLSHLRSEFKREIEVFFKEIYFTIMNMKTSTMHQKLYFLSIIPRICTDPRALVEIYLNYDCDADSSNLFENLIGTIVHLTSLKVPMTTLQLQEYYSASCPVKAVYNLSLPPSTALAALTNHGAKEEVVGYPREYTMKMIALELLVSILRSLLIWSQRGIDDYPQYEVDDSESSHKSQTSNDATIDVNSIITVKVDKDDPSQFETLKTNKIAIDRAITDFNFNPSRGVEQFLKSGIINSMDPKVIARVLLTTHGIDKTQLGLYLGSDAPFNRKVLHEFLAQMDFKNVKYLDALRKYLQLFRLPGEGQVVDRFMLEFASKYHQDCPTVFNDPDPPYILAYSIIMLNTELHSPNVKHSRMTLEDFRDNNRRINDGMGLPDHFLKEIYESVRDNEIKLISEQQELVIKGDNVPASSWLSGRNEQREAYLMASKIISSKTADIFKELVAYDRKNQSVYYNASHVEHIRPMFDVAWMSMLVALSERFQNCQNEPEVLTLCLDGMSLAIRIACHFDVELARESFITALARFTHLPMVSTMHVKHTKALQTLLSIALTEGNWLNTSWYNILVILSQLDRAQLIAKGVSPSAVPDVSNLWIKEGGGAHLAALNSNVIDSEVSQFLLSRELEVCCDKIFTQTSLLSADAIVSFVTALTRVLNAEIKCSEQNSQPRLFCLQKMVDICYYNMERIRVEWSRIWALMGEQFKIILCDTNDTVVESALDSLRQLSMRFLDFEELTSFKFQKDFLQPFDYAMRNNKSARIKTLVLECLRQMVVAKASTLHSGWSAIFSTAAAGASKSRSVLEAAYGLLNIVSENYIDVVLEQHEQTVIDAYLDALAALAKQGEARIALKAIHLLHNLLHRGDFEFWHHVLQRLHVVTMEGEDLEVRKIALDYLFEFVNQRGDELDTEALSRVCQDILFPLFVVLETPRHMISDNVSLWLSTTLIEALRSLIVLYRVYRVKLSPLLDSMFLELMKTCILQENETVSQIGAQCFHRLIRDSAAEFSDTEWQQITNRIEQLFRLTTANELLDHSLLDRQSGHRSEHFRATIMKSIQQVLILQTISDLLLDKDEVVFNSMPVQDIIRVISRLRSSYQFARAFNLDQDLRTQLFQQGFMRQMPNLLMQESSAAQCYIILSMKLLRAKERFESSTENRQDLFNEVLPVALSMLKDYNKVLPSDHRHIKTLNPTIVELFSQFCLFNEEDFKQIIRFFYMDIINVFNKEMTVKLREAAQAIFRRVGDVLIATN